MPSDRVNLEFYQYIFNALPLPIFVVDIEGNIFSMNIAALDMFKGTDEDFYKRRIGNALHCINSTKNPEGCGRSENCTDCEIRKSIIQAYSGGRVHRRKKTMTLLRDGKTVDVHLLVTTSPFHVGDRNYSLLIFEDISEILQLRSLLPICAWCRKVRNDDDYWQNIEEYFSSKFEFDFTHGICYDCYKKLCDEQQGENDV